MLRLLEIMKLMGQISVCELSMSQGGQKVEYCGFKVIFLDVKLTKGRLVVINIDYQHQTN